MQNLLLQKIKFNKKRITNMVVVLIFFIAVLIYSNNKQTDFEAIIENKSAIAGVTNIVPNINKKNIEIEKSNIQMVAQVNEVINPEMNEINANIQEEIIKMSESINNEIDNLQEEEFWDDMELVALVCVAEAEGESEYGKRLVIDCIFNRIDSVYFPNTIKDVIYAPGQWECVSNGRINCVENNEYIANLVMEEYNKRTNTKVIYFRTNHYFDFGTPILQEGHHFFSGR